MLKPFGNQACGFSDGALSRLGFGAAGSIEPADFKGLRPFRFALQLFKANRQIEARIARALDPANYLRNANASTTATPIVSSTPLTTAV
jgi:hypothetical protein